MIIVHTPADGEVEHFDFQSVRTSEASIITSLITDTVTWQQVKERVREEDPDVLRVVAFVVKKRSNPSLRISDFDPLVDELAMRLDRREIEEWVEVAAETITSSDLRQDVVESSLSSIIDAAADTEHARAMVQRLLAGKFPPDPEATSTPSSPTPEESTSSEPGTSGSSPTSSTSTDEPSTS